MLGVLKRRWKPKRVTQVDNNNPLAPAEEKTSARLVVTSAASIRHQVHPVCEDKAQLLSYDQQQQQQQLQQQQQQQQLLLNGGNNKKEAVVCCKLPLRPASPVDPNASPPPYPKRASLDSNPSPTYPLAPNICVEGGRIEFIKTPTSSDGENCFDNNVKQYSARVTVTRGLQTENRCQDLFKDFRENKERLEAKIKELESSLAQAQKAELKDKQTINKLQKQLSKREAAQRDADRERRLRADSESRTKQALQEAARCRSRLKLLTGEFSRMEETVRSMLVYKKQVDQLKQEKTALTVAFENRCQQYQNTIQRLNQEIFSLRSQIDAGNQLCGNSQALLLQKHVEESRKQYEKCLDDVANQVVKALVTQKGLKEEVCALNGRIQELEEQNETLTSMLLHQMQHQEDGGDCNIIINNNNCCQEESKEKLKEDEDNTSADVSPLMKSSVSLKHCNSFNSEIFDEHPDNTSKFINDCDNKVLKLERHLSAGTEVFDSGLSLEDKKRHQVLTKLWTDLKGSEVTPKRLIEALSAVDSALWVPPKRPVSLNLQLPILQAGKYRGGRSRPVLVQSASKTTSEEETTTGNESPESGNRDEGYSTMSSDVVQAAEVSKNTGGSDCATIRASAPLEELKEATDETEFADTTRLTDNKEPDIFYIPINLLNLKPRNSFPPGKELLPFQHIMRSFSDSHLCIKITTAPSPCYSFSSPISSSPSILLLDITDNLNPLRRAKGTASLLTATTESTIPESWSSIAEERLECPSWDAEYIQHWLRLDETRSTMQQQHRELLELEYDKAELEDWSLSLSNEDVRQEQWKKHDASTPGQYSLSTLPSIQENNALELEEDASECLWNGSSYMVDPEGHEIVALLNTSGTEDTLLKQWPYAVNYHLSLSPDNSWSSAGSDYCHSHEQETYSKRSSAALSGCSDDTGELPVIGTDFTRDFYRLVKFESTKSLASTSSRSVGGPENGEVALQNVLSFLAEQQKYVTGRTEASPVSADVTKEFNIEAPAQSMVDGKAPIAENNYVTLKQLSEIEQPRIAFAEEVCLVTPLDVETENCSNMSELPVEVCTSEITLCSDEVKSLSESLTSSVSTPETIVSKIPRRKQQSNQQQIKEPQQQQQPAKCSPTRNVASKLPKSKIPHRTSAKVAKQKLIRVDAPQPQPVVSQRLSQPSTVAVSDIIEGPPHRAVSFHEKATTKDVIDELNRMIKNGDENSQEDLDVAHSRLDEGCMATGWVHVERGDLSNQTTRASLLDVMMSSVSSESSPSSSCGASLSNESFEEQLDYGQLHRIHRYHRQKKANAIRPELAVVRACAPQYRPSIIGRQDFFVRYGEKEKEAVASFDFLDDLSTPGSSHSCSLDDDCD